MKNSPSSRPLKGSRSVSSSRRYSLSASSTPARKAPSAIDRPTDSINAAVATTSSSDAAVKISGVSLRAIQRSAGRSASRPPSTIRATTPTALAAPHQPLAGLGRGTGGQRQQRQQRQDRDGGDVLQQRHAEHALAGAGGHQVALVEHAQADGGGRQRQAQRGHQRQPPVGAESQAGSPGSAASSRASARCPSRRSAGAAPTAVSAPAPAPPGRASAPRRTRRSAGSSRRR